MDRTARTADGTDDGSGDGTEERAQPLFKRHPTPDGDVWEWAEIGAGNGPTLCIPLTALPGRFYPYPVGWPHGELVWYSTWRGNTQERTDTTPWR